MLNDIPTPDTYGTHRNGDDQYAHVETGDVVVPPAVLDQNPDLARHISLAISNMGGDPSSRVVGSPSGNYNPVDGEQEFFFKSIKKFFRDNPLAGTAATIASSFLPGGQYIAPLVAGGTTYLGGGSALQSLGAGAGTYIGGELMRGAQGSDTIGSKLSDLETGDGLLKQPATYFNTGLNNYGNMPTNMFQNAVLSKGVGELGGQVFGGGLGSALGGMFGVPEQATTIPNMNSVGSQVQAQSLPSGAATPLPLPININTPQVAVSKAYAPQGVSYGTPTKNRDTGITNYTMTNSLDDERQAARRRGWGGGVVFA